MSTRKLTLLLLVPALLIPAAATAAPTPSTLASPCAPGGTYDPACDADHDGDVDVIDLQLTAGHWGQTGIWSIDPHDHDDRYYTETELQTDASAGVHWGNLTNVPVGFADGSDDGLTSVGWSDIQGRPAGLDDGDDDTTYTAGAGLVQTGTEFRADTTYVQRRVSGTCAVGSSIRAIHEDGTVDCEPDDSGADGWSLHGNAGTVAGTDVLGTTDPVSLTLVISGTPALRIELAKSGNGELRPNLVGGADTNQASAGSYGATVSGGVGNLAGTYATVGGGATNTASGIRSTVGGGGGNAASGLAATVGGGEGNVASGRLATVGGGSFNTTSGDYATVGGGGGNAASGLAATVGGGGGNAASGLAATVGGGKDNVASGLAATVGGGEGNVASGRLATVGGGSFNTTSGDYATVGGGGGNAASGLSATVGGGDSNAAGGDYATVPGGAGAVASHWGELAYAGGAFADQGDAQTSLYVLRRQTSDATLTELFLDGSSQRITLAADRVMTFDILVVGSHRYGGSSAGYQVAGVIKNIGGSTNFVGTPTKTVLGEDNSGWDVQVEADNVLDALVIKVQGSAATTIRWVASLRTVEVGR